MIQDDSSAVSSSQWSTEDGLSSIDASVSSSEKELPDIYAAIGKTAMTISESNVENKHGAVVDNMISTYYHLWQRVTSFSRCSYSTGRVNREGTYYQLLSGRSKKRIGQSRHNVLLNVCC